MDGSKNPGIQFKNACIEGMVSVVIPAYNRETTIERAVRSCLNQTYPSLEVIVVDDKSKDNTVEILNRIEDKRLRVIVLEDNGGACRARNIGASHANGEWIAFQDSDDEWLPEKIEKQLAFMKNGNYDFSFCQGNLILLNGKQIKSPLEKYGTDADRDWYHVLMTDFPVSTQKFMCKRCVLEKYGFDEAITKSQDKDFALQVSHDFRTGYLAEPLVNIYAMAESITYSANQKKKYDSIFRTVTKHQAEIEAHIPAQKFYYANLGDYSYLFDKKLALSWYQKSLKAGFNKRVLAKLVLTAIGLRKYF